MTFLTKNLRARDARRTLDDKVAHSRHVRVARNTRHSMRAGDRTRRRTVTRQSGTEAAAASAFSLPAVPYAAGGRATASAFGRAGGETAASTMRRFVAGQSGPTTNSWREQLLDRQALHVLGNLSKPDTRVKRHTSSSPLTLSLRPSQEPQSALPKQRPSQRPGLRGRALIAASGSLCSP